MKLIGSAFCDDIHDSGVWTLVRHEEADLDFELIDRGNGEIQRRFSQPRAACSDAINQVTGLKLRRARNADGAVGMLILAGDNVGRSLWKRGRAREEAQLHKVAAIQRELFYAHLIDDGAEGVRCR